MKKANSFLHQLIGKPLARMSLIVTLLLIATISISVWGPNKTVTKIGGGSFALVGLVATFKKKGIELSAEEEEQFKAMDEAFENHTKGFISADDFKKQFDEIKGAMSPEALKKMVEEANKEISDTLTKQAVMIEQLQKSGMPGGPSEAKSLREQIKEQLSKPEYVTSLKGFKDKQIGTQGFQFGVKAAGNMTSAGTTAQTTAATAIAFPTPEFIPGLNNIARNQPFILQIMNVMPTSKENIVFSEKINVQGSANWVGENAAANQVSFDIQLTNSRAKMVTAYIKVSTQMLDDVDYIASEIEKELIYQIAISIDTFLLQGDGTGDNLKGIASFASGYTLTSLSTPEPNNCDAILACATEIASENFRPDLAILNPIDYAQTKLIKSSTGEYVVNPNNANDVWAGVRVVQSNQVPLGYTMVMDSSKTNVYRYQDFMLSYGWINDDFIKHMVTITAHQRMHNFVKSNDTNAFVYDSLADIKAAITAV